MARQRLPYPVVGRAMRHSAELARKGAATPAERVVLAAVHEFTTSYSRLHDHLTLGQIAVRAGLWSGEARDCPRKTTKRVAERLRRLEDMGAIAYIPASRGRGSTGIVVVTRAAEKGDPVDPPSTTEGGPFEAERGTHGGQKGDPVDPPPEEYPEECSEKQQPPVSCNATEDPEQPSAAAADEEASIKAEARRQWNARKRAGEQIGIGVLRCIEQDIREERAERGAWNQQSQRQRLESYWRLGQNRRGIANEDELRAELAGDPAVMRDADLLAAAVAGLHGRQVAC